MIGERLSEIRKDHGDKQTDLAQKLNVTVSTIRSWEQEKSSPSHDMLVQICRLYSVSSDYLLGLTDVDPGYLKHQQFKSFTRKELAELKKYGEYLMWKKKQQKKTPPFLNEIVL